MKRFSIFIIVWILSMPFAGRILGQEQEPRQMMGHVKNNFTKEPIKNAKVQLLTADSVLVDSATSSVYKYNGVPGGFIFNIKKPGNYIIRCQHPDYETSYTPLNIKKFYKHDKYILGIKCYMQRRYVKPVEENDSDIYKTIALDEVSVVSTKVKFYLDGDTLVYNADAFQMAEGSMLEDLIRQLPGTELKDGGVILVNGRQVSSLLLNGKKFFDKDRKLILDNLPHFMVDKVKVYEKMDERMARISPAMKGQGEYVMDVNLKRKYSIGNLANIEAGGGSDDRYLARLFALRFTPNSRLSAYGNINNLSDDRKPGNNGDWSPLKQPVGVTTARNAGVDYNVDDVSDRFSLGGSLSLSHSDSYSSTETDQVNFLEGGDTYENSSSSNRAHSTKIATGHSFEIFKHTDIPLTGSASLSYEDYSNEGGELAGTYSFVPENPDSIIRYAINRIADRYYSKGHSLDGSLQASTFLFIPHYNVQTFYISGGYDYHHKFGKNFDNYSLDYPSSNSMKGDYRNRYNNMLNESNKIQASIVDFINLTQYDRLKPGYSYTRQHRTSNRSRYLLQLLDDWGAGTDHVLGSLPSERELALTFDTDNSSFSTTNENNHRISLEYESERYKDEIKKAFNIKLPVSFLRTSLDYHRAALDTAMHHNDIKFEPHISFSMQKFSNWDFSAVYQSNVSVTPIHYFITLPDNANPLNVFTGNPDLKNQRSHEVFLNYRKILKNERMYHLSSAFYYWTNTVAMGYVYNRLTGAKLTRPENVNGNLYAKIDGGFSTPVDKKRLFTLSSETSFLYNRNVDMIGVDDGTSANVTTKRSSVGNLRLDETLKLRYKPSARLTMELKGDVHYLSARSRRADFSNFDAVDFDYGLSGTAELPFKFQFATDITMYSRRGYTDNTMNTDELVWNVRLSRSFMKGKLVCMLDGFDILNNLSNVRRYVNAQCRIETWSNVTPRYVMLHVILRMHKDPKK